MTVALATITDEKLEEYLGIWDRLWSKGMKLDITLTLDYKQFIHERYTLKYGEEIREVTVNQALKVSSWFDRIAHDRTH